MTFFPGNSWRVLAGLAACAALCVPLAADAPAAASVTVSAASAAGPSAPALSPSAATAPLTYANFLSGAVSALEAPLAAFLAQSGKPSLSVVAGGFRELVTGERSPFCDHLDRDLTTHLRDDSPYGVPSTLELQDAWISMGGNTTDLSLPNTISRFGRLLSVDTVVSGDYLIKGSSLSVTVRLMGAAQGNVLWIRSWVMPMAAVPRGDLNTFSNSAPPGYGASVEAPPPPTVQGALTPASASAASPSAGSLETGPLGYGYSAPPAGVRLEEDVHETEFSLYRVNFGAGYEYYDPLNATFHALVKDMTGPYINVNWADIVHAEFFLWDQASMPELPQPIGSLFGYGMTLSLTAPMRLGHYWIVYGGFGGRFETININNPTYPSQDVFSFGNNSFFGTAGVKAHLRNVGLDLNGTYDFLANYDPYLTVKLGLYYEYNFE